MKSTPYFRAQERFSRIFYMPSLCIKFCEAEVRRDVFGEWDFRENLYSKTSTFLMDMKEYRFRVSTFINLIFFQNRQNESHIVKFSLCETCENWGRKRHMGVSKLTHVCRNSTWHFEINILTYSLYDVTKYTICTLLVVLFNYSFCYVLLLLLLSSSLSSSLLLTLL